MRPKPALPSVRSFACPQCGATLTIRAPGQTRVVSCGSCGSLIDARSPGNELIARYESKITHRPRIPLGARGTIRGETFESLGYLRRKVRVEGTDYEWSETLLWHPHRGYRWLAEFGNHWSYIKNCAGLPVRKGLEVRYLNRTYKKFQSASAETTYVLGEFPWEIRRGDRAEVADFVSPPFILSEEKTGSEVTWSIGEYIDPGQIWEAFQLPGEPPSPSGIAPAQPSPYLALSAPMRNLFLIFLGIAVLVQFLGCAFKPNKLVHTESSIYIAQEPEKARVTKPFSLLGGTTNVEITVEAHLQNNWAYFEMALINERTGNAYNLTRQVEYYSGTEGGEHWSEGSRKDSVIVANVPSDNYYLWLDPEAGPGPDFNYTITVKRGIPQYTLFFFTLGFLVLPYLWFLYRRRSFEYQRWLESDFPMRPLIPVGEEEE